MKLTDLIKQLKREYKSGGEIEVSAITITPDGKVIIGGSFESGSVRPSVFDERVEDGPTIAIPDPAEIRSTRKFAKRE